MFNSLLVIFNLQELDVHIKNIKEKFGEMCPATAKITVDPKNMEKQRMAMFPGAFNRTEDVESSSDTVESNKMPSNGSRMQGGGMGQKRRADGNRQLKNDESSSSTKKTATTQDNVTTTTN